MLYHRYVPGTGSCYCCNTYLLLLLLCCDYCCCCCTLLLMLSIGAALYDCCCCCCFCCSVLPLYYQKNAKVLLLLRTGGAHPNIHCVARFWTARFLCTYTHHGWLYCTAVVAAFSYFRHHKIYVRREILYIYINTSVCFFGPSAFFSLPAAGISSCSRLRGTQRARLDSARKFGPWPRSVARALGVQSRKSARGGIPTT